MKIIISDRKNHKGFVLIFLVLLLPVIITLLASLSRVIYLTEFKNEFRFICLTESAVIHRQLLSAKTDISTQAKLLLQKLRSIKSPLKYYVTLSEIPKTELDDTENATGRLAYDLKYIWPTDKKTSFSMLCGTKALKKEGKWQLETLYSTGADRY